MNVRPIKTRVFKEGEDLIAFIVEHVLQLKDGSILAVTSKIVALSEGRTASAEDFENVVKRESEWAKKTKYVWLTMKDGMILANAGVDESNANSKLVLLPKDSFHAAEELRRRLTQLYGRRRASGTRETPLSHSRAEELESHEMAYKVKLKRLGVVITDSRVMPLRAGVTAVALGYAGFRGLRDYRGQPDIFGRPLKFTQTNIADSLATAAALAMGEGREQQPLCIIEDAPVEFIEESIDPKELVIPPEDDMYGPVLNYAG